MYSEKIWYILLMTRCDSCSMVEASMAVYGAVIGVGIALAIVTFVLRGSGHHDSIEKL